MRDKRITKEQRRHITNARRQAQGNNFRESEKFVVAMTHHSHSRDHNTVTIEEWEYDHSF